jgi:hypothetical protein
VEEHIVGANNEVLKHHILIPFEHGILWELRVIDWQDDFPINFDLVSFPLGASGLGLSAFLFGGQITGFGVPSYLGFALFPFQPIDLIAQPLNEFVLLVQPA